MICNVLLYDYLDLNKYFGRDDRLNRKTTNRLPLYRLLWCRIRYYQQLYDISDDALANALGVHKRTLKEYDKSAENVTFGKLSSLLYKRSDCTLIHGIKKASALYFLSRSSGTV